MFIHSAWGNPEGSPRRLFILGAGFSKQAFPAMPIAAELEGPVREATGLRSMPTSSLESTLAYLAEEHPFDRADEPHRRRLMMVHAIRAIGEFIALRQDEALAVGLPTWVADFVSSWAAGGAMVVSFNYDLFVEKTAERLGVYFSDANLLSRSFTLLKPHGSLNASWMPGKPGTIHETFGDHSALVADQAKGREPFIVPPTSAKSSFYGTDALIPAWQSFRFALETADEIVLVGYSVAEADSTVNGLLSTAIGRPPADGDNLRLPNVVVVDLNPDGVARRLHHLGVVVGDEQRRTDVVGYAGELLANVVKEQFHVPFGRLVDRLGVDARVHLHSHALVTRIDDVPGSNFAILKTGFTVPFDDPSATSEWAAGFLRDRLSAVERIETDEGVLITHFTEMESGGNVHITVAGTCEVSRRPHRLPLAKL